jgi:hypothetical protein
LEIRAPTRRGSACLARAAKRTQLPLVAVRSDSLRDASTALEEVKMKKGHVWSVAAAMAVVLAGGGGASAQMPVDPALRTSLTGQAGAALVHGRAEEALAKADAAIRSEPQSGWAHYARGEALSTLRRHNEAVSAYETAGSQLPASDMRGRSLALWGRASALRAAGRCGEAKSTYEAYVRMVQATDSTAAEQARTHAEACRSTTDAPAVPSTSRGAVESPRAAEPAAVPDEPTRLPALTTTTQPAREPSSAAKPATTSRPAVAPEPSTPEPRSATPRATESTDTPKAIAPPEPRTTTSPEPRTTTPPEPRTTTSPEPRTTSPIATTPEAKSTPPKAATKPEPKGTPAKSTTAPTPTMDLAPSGADRSPVEPPPVPNPIPLKR